MNTGVQINRYYGAAAARPARSAYVRQVEQIFSGELKDRRAELEELAEFCTSPDGRAYVWWQAPAWAGKSALMASFVQDPPAGVRVVSFFITARLAGQSDRAAFLSAVLEQLAVLTGQPLPDVLSESNRQQWFLQLLEEAAGKCAAEGCRLVLVVDGLDEDRGVQRSKDAHSIAALLPGRPPEGVRIVVSGRPNPPVPADVSDWHPLRDPGIVRPLQPSAWAVAFRAAAERELSGLLDDGGLGRDLLGLLVTAGGGLSSRDLSELTDEPVGEIERILHAVTGRSFTGRDPQWSDGAGQRLVLAHEELVQSVLRSLRAVETRTWQQQIHTWADHYRDAGWPQGTPEYLLRGYLQLLHKAQDLPRMRALVTDHQRLDRMLDISKGDGAAMADLITVQEYIRDQPDPDLSAGLHVALARQRLTRRNSNIPTGLPASWVRLNNYNRARALADSITDRSSQAEALTNMVNALSETGKTSQACEVADEAEAVARSITDSWQQAWALVSVVDALVEAGKVERAEAVARSITGQRQQAWALGSVVDALVEAGKVERAEAVTQSITRPQEQASALVSVVDALVKTGEVERACEIADEAEAVARSITNPRQQASALVKVVDALVKTGEVERACEIADEAEAVARSITDPRQQAWALGSVVDALVEAEKVERACEIADEAEAVARSITDPQEQASALGSVVDALVKTGEVERAEAVARSITNPPVAAWSLAVLAKRIGRARSKPLVALMMVYDVATNLLTVVALVSSSALIETLEYLRDIDR